MNVILVEACFAMKELDQSDTKTPEKVVAKLFLSPCECIYRNLLCSRIWIFYKHIYEMMGRHFLKYNDKLKITDISIFKFNLSPNYIIFCFQYRIKYPNFLQRKWCCYLHFDYRTSSKEIKPVFTVLQQYFKKYIQPL